jgi:beta-glucanase (GH16 family)
MRRALLAMVVLALLLPGRVADAGLVWKLSFSDDFNGSAIDGNSWSVYGRGGPVTPHCRDSNNVVVSGGTVTLKVRLQKGVCSGFTTAGMCACQVTTQTYGKFEVRMKATAGDSKIVLLLWGAQGWPPEIDFAEFPGTGTGETRQSFNETLHYGASNSMIHTKTTADMTTWHTVGLEWSPGLITYTLDGVAQHTITSHVPSTPMWLGIQMDARTGVTMNTSAIIDWVHVYTLG